MAWALLPSRTQCHGLARSVTETRATKLENKNVPRAPLEFPTLSGRVHRGKVTQSERSRFKHLGNTFKRLMGGFSGQLSSCCHLFVVREVKNDPLKCGAWSLRAGRRRRSSGGGNQDQSGLEPPSQQPPARSVRDGAAECRRAAHDRRVGSAASASSGFSTTADRAGLKSGEGLLSTSLKRGLESGEGWL